MLGLGTIAWINHLCVYIPLSRMYQCEFLLLHMTIKLCVKNIFLKMSVISGQLSIRILMKLKSSQFVLLHLIFYDLSSYFLVVSHLVYNNLLVNGHTDRNCSNNLVTIGSKKILSALIFSIEDALEFLFMNVIAHALFNPESWLFINIYIV